MRSRCSTTGHLKIADMRASWGGAMGLTQFLPSEFYKHALDFDGDGKKDIWHSVPDALASAAQQLVNKGWQRGVHWAYEVRAPKSVDCTMGVPEVTRPLGEWIKQGFVPAYGRKPSAAELAEPASLLQPEGIYGPSFLTTEELLRHQAVQLLRPLRSVRRSSQRSDCRSRGRSKRPGARAASCAPPTSRPCSGRWPKLGLYKDKVDGKAGMQTRSALGAYQKANNLKVDCWPTGTVLGHMQSRSSAGR